ncbi:Lrp/AsnC family transcriptional regulator [Thiorhodococcus mannitoliphagus]|uniref:Lrp/AsnC family transcriptional regulator n=1 Tax=Thiorhodococcus mannitoliphagus TaxID=329406 RepID=A0A6P1E396_9GAMM|nr:Lrp/AsnC family transcriptional regulator [Thiorhodococcus mannitoliphagus]NEX23811.1 Lrp/AsnC family transcriptional regulator [Thiorhodococcus mannitoliphagus]
MSGVLQCLQLDGRATNASLAEEIHLAEAPTWRRVRALEESGVICGYRALIDPSALGYEVTAFVHVRFGRHDPTLEQAFEQEVREIPQILWCHTVSGATDFLLCVVARNLSEYGELISARIRSLPGVTSIESSFSLKAVKDGSLIPVD